MDKEIQKECKNQYCKKELSQVEFDAAFCSECTELNNVITRQEAYLNRWMYGLVCVWLLLCVSFFTDIYGLTCSINLFGRFGAILTLVAIICEFLLNQKLSPGYLYRFKATLSYGQVGEAIANTIPTKNDQYRSMFFLISLSVGTIVWGFGDLINSLDSVKIILNKFEGLVFAF